MSEIRVLLPKMGESVAEATITKWLKAVGDKVEAEESIVEIATDKVDSEIPSPASGIISKFLFNEGDVVKVGDAIAIIDSPKALDSAEQSISSNNGKSYIPETSGQKGISSPQAIHNVPFEKNANIGHSLLDIPSPLPSGEKESSRSFYSPLIRNIARQEGISMEELKNIEGSGKDGRLTKQDMLDYLPKRKNSSSPINPSGEKASSFQNISEKGKTPIVPAAFGTELTEIIEMNRMTRLMADHMVMSKQRSPHVNSVVEADVTSLVQWREKAKRIYENRYGEKISFTPFFVEASIKAIKDFPMVNVSVDGNKIILKRFINIGIATALAGNGLPASQGGLIVPVIKNADRLNLLGIVKAVNDLAKRARMNKLNPDEVQDGTFTITNIGTFGNVIGSPIISQPQVAILATGIIKKRPAVIETSFGDTIGIRHIMYLSLSYDHRVVDGALGGGFLRRVADYLEDFDINREI